MSIEMEQAARAAYKQRLIADGQLYRVGIVHAKAHMARALRPEVMLHGVLDHVLGLVGARVDTLLAPEGVRAAMPYILTALSFIGRKKLIKPALGVAAAATALWFMRGKHH